MTPELLDRVDAALGNERSKHDENCMACLLTRPTGQGCTLSLTLAVCEARAKHLRDVLSRPVGKGARANNWYAAYNELHEMARLLGAE